jgi:ketosteroid isomerase-like protein
MNPIMPIGVQPQSEDVRGIIERHNSQAEKWYAEGNVEALLSIFAADAWQMPPNMPALAGRDAIRQFWSNAFRFGRWDFTLRTQAVDVSGDVAIERGEYEVRFTAGSAAPMPSFVDRGNYLVHWRHDPDGQWRVVADAPVSELPR